MVRRSHKEIVLNSRNDGMPDVARFFCMCYDNSGHADLDGVPGRRQAIMEQTGEVIKVDNGLLTVQFCRPEACESCRACNGEKHSATIQIPGDAQVGDIVTVSMPEGQVAKASLLAYAMPLAGLMIGLFLGFALGGDIPAVIGAAIGLGLSLLILKLLDVRLRGNERWMPKLVSVMKKQA
jgi:sigma-E factor negative regulatory protein RseC